MSVMFYTQLFTSKRGPLAKIWLAAHWERKLTKAHIFECNLETTVRDILSPKMKIGLRTSGHLLLGVVRIYSRKAKYLLADCNEALVKIKTAFRPGLTDLPEEDLEATVKAITLVEDFTSFDVQLPHVSDIDVVDHFSLNQSRSEEITLKETFGNNFLTFGDFGEDSQRFPNALLDISFQSFSQHDDMFGDEDKGFDLLDFLTNSSDPELTDFIQEEPQRKNLEKTLCDQPDSDTTEAAVAETSTSNQTTLLTNEEEVFALEPVSITSSSEKKRGKRRRKLLVDQSKELSDSFMARQLRDFSDLVAPLDLAPPTVQLMLWKESGGADKLFVQPCSTVVAQQINGLFTQKIFQARWCTAPEGVEETRQEAREVQGDLSSFSANISVDSSVNPEKSHIAEASEVVQHSDSSELEPDETRAEPCHPELPSEDPLLIHPSFGPRDTQSTSFGTQSLLNSQDSQERRITRQSQKLLNSLKQNLCSSDPTFSLEALCRGSSRSQAAATFLCFLVLSKQQALRLHQSAPYQDIIGTPGPAFHQ